MSAIKFFQRRHKLEKVAKYDDGLTSLFGKFRPGAQSWHRFLVIVCWHFEHSVSTLSSREHCTNSEALCQERFVPWLEKGSELWYFRRYKVGATESSKEFLWKQWSLVSTVKIEGNWLWVDLASNWAAPEFSLSNFLQRLEFSVQSLWFCHQHGRNADLAQSRYFMQCYNQLGDVSVPNVLANCNVFN